MSWQEEKIISMKIKNKVLKLQNYNITFDEIKEIQGINYVAMQRNFLSL